MRQDVLRLRIHATAWLSWGSHPGYPLDMSMGGSKSNLLRRVAIPVLARVNPGDVTIKHPWTGDPMVIHSFRHKSYWVHRRSRERDTMWMFAQLISAGDSVVEIGAHVGFVTALRPGSSRPGGSVVAF